MPCDVECKSGFDEGRPGSSLQLAPICSGHSGCDLVVPFGASRLLISSSDCIHLQFSFLMQHLRHTTTFNVHLLCVFLARMMSSWAQSQQKLNKNGDDDAELSQISHPATPSYSTKPSYAVASDFLLLPSRPVVRNLSGVFSPVYLEPPRQRPKTSARTAQRLIAHGMGLKLPIPFGSRELKSQEETRKNRIVTRQKMKDDAWGDD
ncbi:hypothetical protein DKX38_024471 [Salix brachista]|uniref:Uncharacterized protein n=1 Tax=Salix brachista TaxID=2182728 RepID=A0A5N5JMB0_9ROSI|nr:hypothetical protein DKX38_024471 [Salix brachista]